MAVTLDDVTIELMQSNESLGSIKTNQSLAVEYLDLVVDTLRTKVETLVETVQGDQLQQEEDKKEMMTFWEKLFAGSQFDAGVQAGEQGDLKGVNPLIGLLTIALASTIGVIKGFTENMKMLLPEKWKAGIAKQFDDFKMKWKTMFTNFVQVMDDMKAKSLENLAKIKNFFLSNDGPVGKLARFVSTIGKGIGTFIATLAKPFTEAFKVLGGIFSNIKLFGEKASGASKIFGKIAGAFGTVVKFAGAIFRPIAIIVSLFDGFTEGMDAAEAEGGGMMMKAITFIKGFFQGFIDSFIMAPLDLIKDVFSWLLEKIGFDNASKALDNFSFSDLWNGLIDGLWNAMKEVFNWVGELFTDPLSAMKKLWNAAMGQAKNISEFVGGVVDKIVVWFGELFGFDMSGDDGEKWSLSKWLGDKIRAIREWIIDKVTGWLPDWALERMGINVPEDESPTMQSEVIPNTSQNYDTVQGENNKMKSTGAPVIINAPTTNTNVDNSSNTTGVTNIKSGGVKKQAYEPDPADWM